MKILTSLLIVFLFIVGCKREKMWFNDTTVEGILLDSATLEPLQDVEIRLFRYKRVGMLFPYSKIVIIKTKNTNENGEFKIKFNSVADRAYYIWVDLDSIPTGPAAYTYPDLYMNNKWFNFSELDIDTVNKYKFMYVVK